MKYVSAKEAKNHFQINATTLKSWKDSGKLKFKQFSPKKILYDIDSINDENIERRKSVIYARVSNTKQHEDLQRQIEILKQYCFANNIEISNIYSDIASGMNENRKDFNILIDEVLNGNINKIYITFKDRLTRFGFDYFKQIFSKYNTEIVVIDNFENSNQSFQDELANDLISIIHHYSMKLYSNRRQKFKEIEKMLK